eukprot:2246109-Rhodomonas_salina.1
MVRTSGYSSLWEDTDEDRRPERVKRDVIAVALATGCGAAASSLFISLSNPAVPFFLRPIDAPLRSLLLIPPLFPVHNHLYITYGKRSRYAYANAAFGIGVVAASAFAILRREGGGLTSMKADGHLPFGLFMGSLCFYHLAEYLLVAYYNPHMLSTDSFLVQVVSVLRIRFSISGADIASAVQSQYVGAMAVSCFEYFVTKTFLPGMKVLTLQLRFQFSWNSDVECAAGMGTCDLAGAGGDGVWRDFQERGIDPSRSQLHSPGASLVTIHDRSLLSILSDLFTAQQCS